MIEISSYARSRFLGMASFCLALAVLSSSSATEYYFSSSEGNDANPGSYDFPFQTLEKASSIELQPGDKVLFKKGDRFVGHFVVKGSGSADQVIIISSYGEGEQPVITGQVGEAGGGDHREAILVENHDHFLFADLEIHNERFVSRLGVEDIDSYGIHILNSGAEVMENFTFRRMTFRKVYGAKPILPEDGNDAFNGLEVAGIRFFTTRNNVAGQEKHIRKVLVEECFFTDLQRLGVHVKHGGNANGIGDDMINRNMDFVFRNNEFQHTGGTCILPTRTYNCLIENNLFFHPGSDSDPRMPNRGSSVWTWRCINTVIQYNQCISARGHLDSHGIHIDHENHDTFVQYNYMEDCEGGFVEILGGNVNAVYRFNVSVNDGWRENPNWINSNHTIWINEVVPGGTHQSEYTYIYNNTVYMDDDYSTAIDIDGKNTFIYNNIFYAAAGNMGGKQVVVRNNGTDLFMRNNLFSGTVANSFRNMDTDPVNRDPRFDDPTSGSKYGFQLATSSPAIEAGVSQLGPPIPGAGTGIFADIPAYPSVDFYGNPVDFSSETPNIGACNAKEGNIFQAPPFPVSEVVAFPSELSLQIDEAQSLSALVLPALAEQPDIIWSSDNESIAVVDMEGLVTAKSEGWALITASSANGHSDSSYVNVGNAEAGLSAIARQWMWDNDLNPDQTDIEEIAPSGMPYLLHYATGVSPEEGLAIELKFEGNRFIGVFPGGRSDITYGGVSSSDLTAWNPADISAPDSRGMRTISTKMGDEADAFMRIQVEPKQ